VLINYEVSLLLLKLSFMLIKFTHVTIHNKPSRQLGRAVLACTLLEEDSQTQPNLSYIFTSVCCKKEELFILSKGSNEDWLQKSIFTLLSSCAPPGIVQLSFTNSTNLNIVEDPMQPVVQTIKPHGGDLLPQEDPLFHAGCIVQNYLRTQNK